MNNTDIRVMIPSITWQGKDEVILYLIQTPAAEGLPIAPVVVTVLDTTTGEDVTATKLAAGTPEISGQEILLTGLSALTPGHVYRLEVRYQTSAGSTLEPYVLIGGQL